MNFLGYTSLGLFGMDQWDRWLLIKTAIAASSALGNESAWKWTQTICSISFSIFVSLRCTFALSFSCICVAFLLPVTSIPETHLDSVTCKLSSVFSGLKAFNHTFNTTLLRTEVLGFVSKRCSLMWSAPWTCSKDLPKITISSRCSLQLQSEAPRTDWVFSGLEHSEVGVWVSGREPGVVWSMRAQNKGPNCKGYVLFWPVKNWTNDTCNRVCSLQKWLASTNHPFFYCWRIGARYLHF